MPLPALLPAAERRKQLDALLHNPQELDVILHRIADGEFLSAICREYGLKHMDILAFIQETPALARRYETAMEANIIGRAEKLQDAVEQISNSDITEMFDSFWNLKKPEDIPERLRPLLAGIESGKNGIKAKIWNKNSAQRLLAESLKMLSSEKNVTVMGKINIEHRYELSDEQLMEIAQRGHKNTDAGTGITRIIEAETGAGNPD